jgi:hypothetical protein
MTYGEATEEVDAPTEPELGQIKAYLDILTVLGGTHAYPNISGYCAAYLRDIDADCAVILAGWREEEAKAKAEAEAAAKAEAAERAEEEKAAAA